MRVGRDHLHHSAAPSLFIQIYIIITYILLHIILYNIRSKSYSTVDLSIQNAII